MESYRNKLAELHRRNTRLVQDYMKNKAPKELQEKYNVSRQRFYQILKAYGVKYRQGPIKHNGTGRNGKDRGTP